MKAVQDFFTTYAGFYGYRHFDADREEQYYPTNIVPRSGTWNTNGIPLYSCGQINYIGSKAPLYSSLSSSEDKLFLSGILQILPSQTHIVEQFASALKSGSYSFLRQLEGNYVGCLTTKEKIYLFKSFNCKDDIYYYREKDALYWSTDIRYITDQINLPINNDALMLCCEGNDACIYPDIQAVARGHVVILDARASTLVEFDSIAGLELPTKLSLLEYAELAHHLLLKSTKMIAQSGRIGVLLSGGIDSAAVMAALVESGASVIGYHMEMEDPEANESLYARQTCEYLSVPFISVPANCNREFLPNNWPFPLPYDSLYYQWLRELADRMQNDNITILATGMSGDATFGPHNYGLYDIIFGNITWREKITMCLGALSTTWDLPQLMRSLHPSHPIIHANPGDAKKDKRGMFIPYSDFLVPSAINMQQHSEASFSSQQAVLTLRLWKPRGITMYDPYSSHDLESMSASLPNAYRLVPYHSRKIPKPVLRLAFANSLPPKVVQRYWRSLMNVPPQTFCIKNAKLLLELLGSKDTQLVKRGIIDAIKVKEVLSNTYLTRVNANWLVPTIMVEVFLRGYSAHLL